MQRKSFGSANLLLFSKFNHVFFYIKRCNFHPANYLSLYSDNLLHWFITKVLYNSEYTITFYLKVQKKALHSIPMLSKTLDRDPALGNIFLCCFARKLCVINVLCGYGCKTENALGSRTGFSLLTQMKLLKRMDYKRGFIYNIRKRVGRYCRIPFSNNR